MRSFVFFLAVAASTVFAFPTKRDFVSTPATGTQGGGQCNIGFDCCGGTLPDGRQFSCACPPLEKDVSSSTLQKCLKYLICLKCTSVSPGVVSTLRIHWARFSPVVVRNTVRLTVHMRESIRGKSTLYSHLHLADCSSGLGKPSRQCSASYLNAYDTIVSLFL